MSASAPGTADAGAADGSWTGKAAFALGLLSTATYFATSLGIRHFAVFVVDAIRKALHAFGVAT